MVEIVEKGGIMMIPILASSALALAIILERAYVLIVRARPLARETRDRMFELVAANRREQAVDLIKQDPGLFGRLYLSVLEEPDPDAWEQAASLTGSDILFQLNRRLSVLTILGSVLPLMGLLGTVLGMIKVFTRVAQAGDAADITMLAGGIWEALITTAAGMAVAIPVLLINHGFRRTLDRIAHLMQQKVSQLIQLRKREASHG